MSALSLPVVLNSIQSLPSLPEAVLDLLASMDDGDADIDVLACKIARDLALTARTLRLANSSFYGATRKVSTVAEAMAILGFHAVRNLATTAVLMESLGSPGNSVLDAYRFWRHAIGAAVCARAVAVQIGQRREEAYIAGLLHDIGRLVLATQFPAHYLETLAERGRRDCTLLEAERSVLELDHAVVGGALAQHWKFPPAIQSAVANHHAPDTEPGHKMSLVVHAGDAIAHALDFSDDEDDLVPGVEDQTWKTLGLTEQTLGLVFKDAKLQFETSAALFANSRS